MTKWAQLDSLGNYIADVPQEYVEENKIPPFPNWTKDHPGDMPGNGAKYVNGIKAANEWTRGDWAYNPPSGYATLEEMAAAMRK